MFDEDCDCGFSLIPYHSFTQFTPALPKFYYDVYSHEQRVKAICLEIDKLMKYSEYLTGKVGELSAVKPEDLSNAVTDFNNQLSELDEKVETLTQVSMDYNVAEGKPTDSVDAHKEQSKLDSMYAFTVNRLNAVFNTVDSLANCGMNCAGVAVLGSKFDEFKDMKVPKKYLVGGYNV